MAEPAAKLYLRKGADRRLRGGHLWVYSNETDSSRSPLGQFQPGEAVQVVSAGGQLLGSAYMEPQSLICARLYAPGTAQLFDERLCSARVEAALALRDRFFSRPCYRLIYGDSDGLPGVVADRFGEYLVVQLNNAGIERYREPLLQSLQQLVQPRGILLRLDSRARREQGLEDLVEVVAGEVPQQVALEENGVHFEAPVFSGQKTGWFYDHRIARAALAQWVEGRSVLDVYSYIGAWGVQAAAFGAGEVCCLDSSAPALEGVARNAALNGLQDRVSVRRGSAPETMSAMRDEGLAFDVVVLDPPAFIQRRRDLKKGFTAYRRINQLALQLLRPGGLLVSASCSMHLSRADLVSAMQQAAVRSGCSLRIVGQYGQGPDHPVHPAIPETEYLKSVFALKG